MAEEHVTEGMRKAIKRAVTESAAALGLEIPNIGQTRSRRDYNRYEMSLPGSDTLIVETAVITPASPAGLKSIQSFVGEYCDAVGLEDVAREYGLEPFEVLANSAERTFCDKVFALCDYYLAEEPIPTRQSRHIYDLRKLQSLISFDDELERLFATVRRQRRGKNRCPSAEPGVDLAAVLRELADEDVYKGDYVGVTMDLLYDDMPYEEAVKALRDVADFVDGIDWDAHAHGETRDYSRIFPKDAEELERMLAASEATPLSECEPMEDALRKVEPK